MMSKWEFTIKELKALQQERPDTPAIVVTVTADKFVKFETKPNKKNRVGKIMFVPHQTSFMEFDFRVINLSRG